MADYPDDLDRLAEWRRKRANEEERRMVAGVEFRRDLGRRTAGVAQAGRV